MSKELLNHNRYLTLLKRLLKADFVGWIDDKGKLSLKVKVGKNIHFLPLEGGDTITEDTYNKLINELLDGKT